MPVSLNNPRQGRNLFLLPLALSAVLGFVQEVGAQNREQPVQAIPLPSAKAQKQPPAFDDDQVCAQEIEKAERLFRIPLHLLQAISYVESGRWDAKSKSHHAWPWTVMAEGKGRYFPNKAAAIAEVMALQAKGIKNIDVGCMQINLHYHPQAFADLEEAFTPNANVAYAARFLKKLRQEMRSWTMAVGRYHSANDRLASPYRSKAIKAWRVIQKNANRARQTKIKQKRRRRLAFLHSEKKKTAIGGNSLERLAKHQIKIDRDDAESSSPRQGLAAVKKAQLQAPMKAKPLSVIDTTKQSEESPTPGLIYRPHPFLR